MLKHFKKIAGSVAKLYGEPGAGVTVYATPDSLADFYRLAGVNAPFGRPGGKDGVRKAARRLWIWGGGAAVHQTRLTLDGSNRPSACMDC